MQIESILVNELQLGSRLNNAVENQRRGEFGLLLAMLSADSTDMAQFQLDKALTLDEKLYKQFELPKPITLVADLSENNSPINNGECFNQHGFDGFRLQQALTPEALITRGRHDDGVAMALANTDPVTKAKFEQSTLPIPQLYSDIDEMHFVDQLARQRQLCQTILAA
ncbi:VC2046/SO_2500 family protein [Shewanella gaetbuli]|uniref:QueD-like protein n=1 Tax=Shewanella gaetbuli TaxID=220752 RepID=A0A9X2CGL2_9GAMM|nr:VC2046/SO_2500 family protein [Shewanella gaetbuli]MCL1142503.1 queD-like protein [Shewanella gaetbuli]